MPAKKLPNAKRRQTAERHEWESFLALLPVFDLGAVDPVLYERCHAAVFRLHLQPAIDRHELARAAGLDFHRDTLQFDLIVARLVREGFVDPVATVPFRFRLRRSDELSGFRFARP